MRWIRMHHHTTRGKQARREHDYNKARLTWDQKRWTMRHTQTTREKQARRAQDYNRMNLRPWQTRCAISPSPKGWHPQVQMVPMTITMLPTTLTPMRQVAGRPRETQARDRPGLDKMDQGRTKEKDLD